MATSKPQVKPVAKFLTSTGPRCSRCVAWRKWIGAADADYAYHEAGTTSFHATHIAVHELAHTLLGHRHTAAWDKLIDLLAPDVDQALIQLILGRSAYGTAEEREAETMASLILGSTATGW